MNKYQKSLQFIIQEIKAQNQLMEMLYEEKLLTDKTDKETKEYKDKQHKESIKLLQELCNKEIPLKPILEKDEIGDRGAFGGTGFMTFTNAVCPCCNEYLDEDKKDNRCQECGQLIDWTEEMEDY